MKKRYIFAMCLMVLGSFLPARPLYAQTVAATPPLLIAAIQTGQEGAVGNDFVVLHNATTDNLDITGWKLQYRAAGSTGNAGWSTKRTMACPAEVPDCSVKVAAKSNVVLSTYDIQGIERQPLTSGFSDSGGQVRIVRPGPMAGQWEVIDMLGYGNALEAEALPAATPELGKVLVRKHNVEQELLDTNNNYADFHVGCYEVTLAEIPMVISCTTPPLEEPDTDTPVDPSPDIPPVIKDPEEPIIYPALFITELLPDPESPATDSADEFIELHNPHTQTINVKGYILQTGTDFRYQYTLGEIVLPAGGYAIVTSAESHLSLSNGGTSVRLVGPDGVVLDMVSSYGQAKAGQSWAKSVDGWRWTQVPTPGAVNVFKVEAPKAVLAAAAAAKKAASKKPAVTTPKAAKAATQKAAKASASTPGAVQSANTSKPQEGGAIQYWILGGIGMLIAGYAIYEYRRDITRWARNVRSRFIPANQSKQQKDSTLQTD